MRQFCRVILCAFVGVFGCCTAAAESGKIDYPKTCRVEHVDVYHGTKVADPYRWLETDVRESQQTADWVTAQNKLTFGYLESIPQRGAIRRRLTELWNYERYSSPFKEGRRRLLSGRGRVRLEDLAGNGDCGSVGVFGEESGDGEWPGQITHKCKAGKRGKTERESR